MNLTETHDLLTLIARFDNRRFDDATVIAWREVLADLTPDDCRRAVIDHFGHSEAYLMPVHVVQAAAALAHQRAAEAADELAEATREEYLGRGVTDRSAEISAFVHHVRDVLPRGNPAKLRGPAWRARTGSSHLRALPALPEHHEDIA